MAASEFSTVAGFVGATHPAYFLQFWPSGAPRGHIVYLPPFAEEMNRCRSLVARQARQFARDGLSCTILDFHGTGESPGDLTDASLSIWRQNIDDLLDQLLQVEECPVYLWGCRLGSLLAMDYLAWKPGVSSRLLLWQPVASGSSFVTQMLRQRMASLVQKGHNPGSTLDMKLQLAAGNSFEVAGYRIGGELLTSIDQIEIASMQEFDKLEIFWLEHTTEEGAQPGARSRRSIAQLEGAGAKVKVDTFTGDPVWQLHKRGVCDDLLSKTGSLQL